MKKLILVFHPNYESSAHIKGAMDIISKKAKNTDIVVVDKDGKWDVAQEQARLLKYDVITFAYPIWWYTAPWTYFKYWSDVFTPGYAFGYAVSGKGIEQFQLKDKKFATIISAGSYAEAYTPEGLARETAQVLNNHVYSSLHLITSGWPVTGTITSDDKFMVAKIEMFGSAMSADDNWSKAAEEYLELIDSKDSFSCVCSGKK